MFIKHTFSDFYIYLIRDTSGKTIIQALPFHSHSTAQIWTNMVGCHEEKKYTFTPSAIIPIGSTLQTI